jgi:hypothetical protein
MTELQREGIHDEAPSRTSKRAEQEQMHITPRLSAENTPVIGRDVAMHQLITSREAVVN